MKAPTVVDAPAIKTSKNASAARLSAAILRADAKLKPFREHRVRMLKEYTGPYYGGKLKGAWKQPVNLHFMLVSTLTPLLYFRPKVDIRPRLPQLREFAARYGLETNFIARQAGLDETLRACVVDALLQVGIVKQGMGVDETAKFAEPEGWQHDPGRPYCDTVDLDDYVIDPDCKVRSTAAFEGNRFRVPRRWAIDCGLYKGIDKLPANERAAGKDERAESLTGENADERFVDEIELMELWLPHEGVIVTLSGDPSGQTDYLREAPWEGHERGPYELLGFNWVPGNILPVSILGTVNDLVQLINKLARKIGRQAERQKDLVLTTTGNEDEAGAVRDAVDGSMIHVKNPKDYQQVSIAGPNAASFQTPDYYQAAFNLIAGNPNAIGGLAPQSKTLGQDQLLYQAASSRINDWREQVKIFAGHIFEKMALDVWDNTDVERTHTFSSHGIDISVPWNSERKGERMDYAVEVAPYAFAAESPEQQYQRTAAYIKEIVLPLAPLVAPQGKQLNVEEIVTTAARQSGLDIDPSRIFVPGSPMELPNVGTQPTTGGGPTDGRLSMAPSKAARPSPSGQAAPEMQEAVA